MRNATLPNHLNKGCVQWCQRIVVLYLSQNCTMSQSISCAPGVFVSAASNYLGRCMYQTRVDVTAHRSSHISYSSTRNFITRCSMITQMMSLLATPQKLSTAAFPQNPSFLRTEWEHRHYGRLPSMQNSLVQSDENTTIVLFIGKFFDQMTIQT